MLKKTACAAALVLTLGAAHANEDAIKKAVEAKLDGAKVESVTKTPYLGLYEVNLGGELIYTDDKVSAFFSGDLIDAQTMRNVTQERQRKLSAIKFSDLPLEHAVKQVRGNGKRVIATFEDPNCGYCKRFTKDLLNITDVTHYTFLYPILSPDSAAKSKAIWCATDKAKAWNDWMINNVTPSGEGKCKNPVDEVVTLGKKLRINGTPTVFFTDGERIPGAVPAAQIEQKLKQLVSAK